MKKIYCTNCGKKQNEQNIQCEFCHKKILLKNHPIKDVLCEYTKSDIDGKVKDSIFGILTNFIKQHLYGFILTLSVIGTITASIVSHNVTSPKIVKEKYEFISVPKYTDSQKLLTDFIVAIKDGDSKKVKSMMYETYYPEKYREYYSETEHYILNDIDGNIMPSRVITDYLDEIKEKKQYYVEEFHNHYLGKAEDVIAHGHFEEQYFEEVEKIVYDGKDIVEGTFSLAYCVTEAGCTREYDYSIFSFYLLIKENENWYVYKTLSDEELFQTLINDSGIISKIE